MIKNAKPLHFFKKNSSSFFALVLRALGVLILLGITVFITNYFNPVYVGEYEFVRGLLLLGGSVIILGFDQAILQYSGVFKAKNTFEKLYKVYQKMIKLIFLISLLILALVYLTPNTVIVRFFNDELAPKLVFLTASALFFHGISALNTELFRAYDHVLLSEFFRGIVKYVPFLLGVFVLHLYNLESYLYPVFLASFVLLAMLSSILAFRYKKKGDFDVVPKNSEILKKSYPMAVSSLGFFLLLTIDIIILKKYTDYTAIAHYATAVKLVLIVSTVLNTINALFATRVAERYHAGNFKSLQALTKQGARLIFALAIGPLLMLIFFPGFILSLFGETYIQASGTLVILALGYLISTVCGMAAVYLNMTGRARLFQYILIIAVVINLILNLILIPTYGIEGAAISSGVAIAFWNIAVIVLVLIKDKIRLFLS